MKTFNLITVVFIFILFSCDNRRRITNESQDHVNLNIEESNVDLHEISLQMAAGELNINKGTDRLLTSSFNYPIDSWKPKLNYEKNGGVVTTSVNQDINWNVKNVEGNNEWDLFFDPKVPLIIDLTLGAGESDIDLSGANVKTFKIETGAGESTINLSDTNVGEIDLKTGVGEVKLDLSGKRSVNNRTVINGGIGQLIVYIPQDVGVRARVSGFLGEVNHNIRKEGNYYVNESYGQSKITMELIIAAGIGEVTIREK